MASVTQYLANTLGKWDQRQRGTDGAAHTRTITGTGETSKNRYLSAVTNASTGVPAVNTMTWTPAENVTELTIACMSAAELSTNDNGMLVVFDSIDDASAKLLLDDAGGAAVSTLTHLLIPGESRTFTGTSYFSRADFKSIGSATISVVVEAQ